VRHPLVQRGLIALVQVLAMGVWFSASIGGWAADRLGRAATAAAALAVSGACCLLSPLFFDAGRAWLLAFATVWGPRSSPTPACSPPC
jgi:MFS family permease